MRLLGDSIDRMLFSVRIVIHFRRSRSHRIVLPRRTAHVESLQGLPMEIQAAPSKVYSSCHHSRVEHCLQDRYCMTARPKGADKLGACKPNNATVGKHMRLATNADAVTTARVLLLVSMHLYVCV